MSEELNNINIPSWYTPAIDKIQNHINRIIEIENTEFKNKYNINIPAITFLRKDNFIENGEFNDEKFNELFDNIMDNLPENFEYSRKNYSIEKIKNYIKNDLIGVMGGRTHHFYLENKDDSTNVDISFCIACPYTDSINTKQTAIHELTHGIQNACGKINRNYEIESISDNLMHDSKEYKDLMKKWNEIEKEINDNFAGKPDKIEEKKEKMNGASRNFGQLIQKLRKKFDNMFIIDLYINKYIVESQADLCGNIFLMLKALQDNNPIEIENLKKQLLYDTQAKFFENGYNAYSIQVELTKKMEENPKGFKNTFLDEDKQIDFKKIFNYTYELIKEKSKIYEEFLKNEKEKGNLIYDKEFQNRIKEDPLNPIGAEIKDKREYDRGYLLEFERLFGTVNESILGNINEEMILE